ncbi:NACHT, LRR and PYD domains-containing protein 14-like isoform X2 [Hyla sarda]|nr:NACHT, LRR and PYD domains-containing protein 14-like isoform X2 [Hyla sarda]XP_056402837.1 NACHT, LRR and PYD domains-containing protein 14-like isoform X2 [Hyla sarda]XP_056402838.1 NACHT, LRR and PYD domains-containing protein 14-like isoform X2 [Hyla sarda]XP_056402839.1 NACHT, LRR and PYD domains-containing protein 14-like isoform X2 [Hyla sarda]XP_056402840.1 NACHT, LRR and PYD domains-containing protein 14-like isoform X2 [Hyla sarda]XP_056402841.1 NACHT, LRR and PYD domains-containi
MGQFPTRYGQEEKLHQLLSTYEMSDLRNVYQYLTNDLVYIVQSLETEFLLKEMASWNVLKVQKYEELRKDLDSFAFSEKMVQDILDQGREAILAFWECLYEIYCLNACSNLSCLVYELGHSGDTLMQQIQQDKHGHSLSSELKDLQKHHKQHLLGNIQNVVNRRRSTSKPEMRHGDHYMDMIVLYVDHFRRRSQHELVESGVKHESYLHKNVQHCVNEFISIDRLFRWSQRFKCVPHSVMITGATGVGKTTLIKKLVYDWAHGKIYQRFSFVFFFRFRELNRLDKVSLETMILQLHPHLQSHLTNILQSPEKILFIFEGLDESVHQMNFRSHQLCTDMSQVEDVGLIVVSLVRQSLLKGCFVILTSKTARVTRRDAPAFMRIAEMTGLSPKDKEMFFQNYFKEKTLSDQVLSYVKNNGAIYNFCYNPAFCRIVCEVLSVHCKDQPMDDHNLPKTVTQLMAGFVGKILSGQKQNKINFRKLLASLGWMAEHGLSNNIRDFEENVLDKFKVDATSDLLQYFMLKSGNPPNVTFSFLHLFLSEFLAALVHYTQYSAEKLNKLLENANSSKDCHDEIFLCFLCGLADQATRDTLKPYLGDLSSRAIVRAVKCVSTWLVQQSSKEAQKLEELQYDKRKCLTMFYYLFETQNKNLVKEALGSCKRLTLKSVLLTRLDCAVLSFVLESCKEIEELDLDDCTLHTDCLGQFTAHLHNLKDIRLLGVKMGNDGIQSVCPALLHPESKVQSLWLGWNKLTDVSCLYLSLAIRNNRSLKILDLSNNALYGPHFSDLMDALSAPACRIEELLLDSAGLTDISCIQLASGIKNNRSLRKLHLSRNVLIGPHFGALVAALSSPTCGIEELELCSIELTDEHVPLLDPLSNNTHLTHLDLSSNLLTDAGAGHIKELILKSSSLKEFSLCFNHRMTPETRQSLRDLKVHKPDLFVFIDG